MDQWLGLITCGIARLYFYIQPVNIFMIPFSWFHKVKHIFFLISLILPLNQNWDRETNPSQKNTSEMYLLCCHLDVNRLVLHGFTKVSLLETYNSIHLYDLMYVSETYKYFRCPPFNQSLLCEITIRICPSCLLPANTNKLWIWELVITLRTNCGWYVYE